ncbi:MAG: tRNA pseudouridine(55) synthase TruB [Gammaproteobacteria bacterium]|nr:tRNA pseudouridine(55) synthase TruB [Gammaproteobacteria bacterium]
MSKRGRNKGRNIHGVLLLDKPSGITSNDALQKVKRLYDARKAGHTGSLDKTATGLLPICFGEATKFSSHLLNADKQYRALCILGSETSTGDAAGEVINQYPVPDISEKQMEQVLTQFRGEIEQVPPMYSALKVNGQRLYKLAYQGLEVERKARSVYIKELNLINKEVGSFEIDVLCSKGTYIRTLAEDIGKKIGCGAHVGELRRIGSGPFSAAGMIDMQALEQLAEGGTESLDAKLLAVDTALLNLPELSLTESVAFYLCQGQAVTVPNAPSQGLLRLYDNGQRFLGLGEVLDDGRIRPRRLISL